MGMLSDEERARLIPAELAANPTPVPTQVVSSDEFLPIPQTERQKKVEARMNALADDYGRKNGLARRRFFQTAAGMATAFVAMNEVYGPLYGAAPAEAKSVDLAQARADGLKDQFIMDVHTHFLRDDTRLEGFVRGREAVGKAGWRIPTGGQAADPRRLEISQLVQGDLSRQRHQGGADQRLTIGGAARLVPDQRHEARCATRVNAAGGSRRGLRHASSRRAIRGRMDEVDRAIATSSPNSWKGYTVGDNTHKELSTHPWRMDDENLVYPFYEKIAEGRPRHRLRPQGPLSARRSRTALAPPHRLRHGRRCRQGGERLAHIRFVIYHSAFAGPARTAPRPRLCAVREDRPGRMDQRSRRHPGEVRRQQRLCRSGHDLRPDHGGRAALCAALMGMLIKGMGVDHVVWGTDALWTGAPQWQIEGLRRLEIPEDMRKKYRYAELGPADGPVERAILGDNSARMYRYDVKKAAWRDDRFATIKSDYERNGRDPSNRRYGFVVLLRQAS